MQQITKSTAIWAGIIALVGHNALYALQGFTISKFVADLAALALLTYMTAFTTPSAAVAFRRGLKTANDRFLFSYWFIWTLALSHRFWILALGLIKRAHGGDGNAPEYLAWSESPISGNIGILIAIAAAYGAVAPLTGPIKMARDGYIVMVISASLAALVVGIAIGVYIIGGWVS
jgi:hypothetical protein